MSENLIAAVHSRVDVLAAAADARMLAAACGLGSHEAEALALVVAELGMNALKHGGGGGLLTVALGPEGWTVVAQDAGPGLPPAVLADAGRSDHLGAKGVRAPGDGLPSFGSGLASVRRLSSRVELSNPHGGGARAAAHKDLTASRKGVTS
jgi:anti-sigma regulatory factor (Ser/Thr protein kinase)